MKPNLLVACMLASATAYAGPTVATDYANVVRDLNASGGEITQHVVSGALGTTEPMYRSTTAERVYNNPNTRTNDKLLVFLPGCGEEPADTEQFLMRAASKGSRAIGLMYWNTCAVDAKTTCADNDDACYADLRHFQYNNGATLPSGFPQGAVNDSDSVRHRLRKLLTYLDANFPNQGWAQFAADGAGHFDTAPYINWSLISLAGHSEGTKVGAYIAAHETLAKAMFFSGPNEHINKTPIAGAAQPWTVQSGFRFTPGTPHTDPTRIYYFWSENDDNATDDANGGSDGIVTNDVVYCVAKAMHPLDAPSQPNAYPVDGTYNGLQFTVAPAYHSGYHALYSTRLATTPSNCGGHGSTVIDCGQTSTTLVYQGIWDYLLAE